MTTLRESPVQFARHVLHLDPHPGQQRFLEAKARVKVACCGRRFGKSFAVAADLIHFAVMHSDSQQFVVAPTHDQSQIIFKYVQRMLRESDVAGMVSRVVYSPFPEVHLTNGSVIRARSSGADGANLRGHGADRIVIDEAAWIPTAAYDTITPILANSQYGELVLISTPFGRNTFFDYWTRGQTSDPDVISLRFKSAENPHLSPSYLEQQKRDMTALAFSVEYEAEFAEDQNSVFPWSLIQSCLRDDIDGEPLPGHTYVIGWDPAQYSDRSGVAVLDITDKPWKLVRCFDISGRDYPVQETEVKKLHEEYGNALVLLDATSHAPVLQHLELAGVKAAGFTFTNTTKRELIDGTVLAMEQAELVFPLIPDLREELLYYRYEITTSGNIKLGADAKHHDDLVTALALAVQAAKKRRPSEPAAPFVMAGSNRWGET